MTIYLSVSIVCLYFEGNCRQCRLHTKLPVVLVSIVCLCGSGLVEFCSSFSIRCGCVLFCVHISLVLSFLNCLFWRPLIPLIIVRHLQLPVKGILQSVRDSQHLLTSVQYIGCA